MKILQANVQSLRKSKDEVIRVLNEENYDVGLLSETWTKWGEEDSRQYKLSGYHSVLSSRSDGYGGVGVFIHKNWNYEPISVTVNSDLIQCAAVNIMKLNIVVVAIYVSPSISNDDFEDNMESLFHQLNTPRTVLGGDFNCHHYVWGNEKCDRKGAILMDIINNSNLILLNNGAKTFVPLEKGKSATAIDLSLTSGNLFCKCQWKVLPLSVGGSAHRIIEIKIDQHNQEKRQSVIIFRKVHEEISKLNSEDVSNLVEFRKKIQSSVKKHRRKSKYTPKAWWDEEVERAWKDKREAMVKFNRESTIENAINIKKMTAIFIRAKKKGIRKQIEELANSIDPATNSKVLWNKIGRLTGKKDKKVNNPVQENKQYAEKFFDLHFGPSDVNIDARLSYGPTCNYNLINTTKWEQILAKKKSWSAPSNDMITYGMLKQLKPEVRNILIRDMNDMFISGSLPSYLKEIKIIAIPKAGKDQSLVEGKRPISLLPTITKIINSAVLEKIQQHIEVKRILPRLSFGFRKNVSTSTCLNYVVNQIKQNKREKYITAAVFIDISNAYNAVKCNKLEEIMQGFNFPSEIVTWISSFLTNRKITMQVAEQNISRMICDGLPQGDVLSPTLFNIYTAVLHSIQHNDGILVQFADDFAILIRGKNIQEVNQSMQNFVSQFVENAEALNLKINPNKTKALLFHGGNRELRISINNTEIETLKRHKFLGLEIDRFLRFECHTRNTKRKINERLSMIKVINGIHNGGHPQTMNQIYNALIRNGVEYGSSIFNNTCKTNKKSLQVTLNGCLRKTTGCTKTTPLNTLMALAGQEPWEIRSKFVASKEIAKSMALCTPLCDQFGKLTNFSGNTEELTYIEKIFVENSNIFNCISQVKHTIQSREKIQIQLNIGMEIRKAESNPIKMKQLVLCLLNGKYQYTPKIYTDASKAGEACGIGIYVESHRRRLAYRLEYETSIMTAEIIAIKVATEQIKHLGIKNAVIITDSLSACTLLENSQHKQYRSTLVEEILANCHFWNTSLQWIPSHINIIGNDIADQLAKQGTHTEAIIKHELLFKDACLMLQKEKQITVNQWYTEYAQNKGQKFFAIQKDFSVTPWYCKQNLNNKETRTMNRLMAGHDYSKYWLNKMKLEDSPDCENCNEPETAEHIILKCTRFDSIRTSYSFHDKFQNMTELLKTKDTDLFKQVVSFINQTRSKI